MLRYVQESPPSALLFAFSPSSSSPRTTSLPLLGVNTQINHPPKTQQTCEGFLGRGLPCQSLIGHIHIQLHLTNPEPGDKQGLRGFLPPAFLTRLGRPGPQMPPFTHTWNFPWKEPPAPRTQLLTQLCRPCHLLSPLLGVLSLHFPSQGFTVPAPG